MKSRLCLLLLALSLGLTQSVSAAVVPHLVVTDYGAFVGNDWTVDIDTDLTSMAVYVILTQGTVYDPFTLIATLDGSGFGFPGDTYFTANGSATTGIAGGAGDLGHINPNNPGAEEIGPTVLGVSWFSPGADTDDIGTNLPIGRFSFSSDAIGAWTLTVGNDTERGYFQGEVINGRMPEPASLALLGLGGLALLWRR